MLQRHKECLLYNANFMMSLEITYFTNYKCIIQFQIFFFFNSSFGYQLLSTVAGTTLLPFVNLARGNSRVSFVRFDC